MNIVYDAAVLGMGHRWEKARTGVFRVVENVAIELARDPSLSLRFCATAEPIGTGEFLRGQPVLADVPFHPERVRLALDRIEGSLLGEAAATGARWSVKRIARGAARRALSRVRRRLPVVGPTTLRDADVFHSPFYPLPATTRRQRLRRVLTVYDLIAIAHPELFEAGVDTLIKDAMASLTPDDWAVCISEATRRDLLAHRPDLAPNRVLVTHLAAATHFRPDLREQEWPALRAKYNIPEAPYALTLSTLEPRKNIAHVLRCFARVVAEGQVGDLRLVMVGTRGWKMDSIFAELDGLQHLRDRVTVSGFVPDRDLAPVYSRAVMFVYPSLYEGFGLPPLEAMQCGVPVITSDTSSLPEVVGDAGLMVPPTDSDALCQAIVQLYSDAALRETLARKARERAKQFSWARCAAETISVYRRAVAVPG